MHVTLLPDVLATSAQYFDLPWLELVARCKALPEYASKGQCPLIKLARFGDRRSPRGALRHDGNLLSVSGVEGDYDGGVLTPEAGAMLLGMAGIESLIYTSPSHTPTAPRWRVLAPFSTALPPEAHRALLGRVNGALGGVLAPESFALSQTYFIGRVTGVAHRVIHVPGEPVDTLAALQSVVPVPNVNRRPEVARTDADIAELRSALAAIPADDYNDWIAMGQALSCLGDEGLTLWREWSSKSSKYDGDERWYTFAGTRTGFAAVFARAQRAGWVNPKARQPLDITGVAWSGAGAVPAVAGPVTHTHAPVGPVPSQGSTLASPDDQVNIFKGCTYVQSLDSVLIPGGYLLNKSRFDSVFGGYAFVLDRENAKMAKGAWDAFTRSQAMRFPKAHEICFRPECQPGAVIDEAGQRLANIWWPVQTASVAGDVGPFLEHVAKLLPDAGDRASLLAYMAALVQHPGAKFQWCPLIQGAEGNGKTVLIRCIEQAVGERYTHLPNAQDLGGNGGKFTGWLRGKLFIGIEEIKTAHKLELLEVLKPLITNPRGEIQNKGADQVTGDNRANFMLLSNWKDAIPASVDKRRYAIYFTAQQGNPSDWITQCNMGGSYFHKLYTWLRSGGYAHVTHWLQHYAIPEELNPATMLQRAPDTSSTKAAIEASLGPIEQEIQEAVGRGDAGFCGGWISSIMLGKMLERKSISLRRQVDILTSLGYVHHPALPGGRVDNPVQPDNGKPRLFIKAGHIACNEMRRAEVARMYSQAQPTTFGGVYGAQMR